VVDADGIARAFAAVFGRAPRVYRAPGRVNLIGEHTDYNDGFVMPMALDRSTWVAAAARDDRRIVVRSRECDETVTIDLDHGRPEGLHKRSSRRESRAGLQACHWADYVRGVATLLESPGADMLIASDVPIGAGLSSSAALEVACGLALSDLAGIVPDLDALARVAQRAEHEYAGTLCGIMDQMIACHGRAGHVMRLDTRTLECLHLPLPSSVRVVVCNTMVAHELASAEYNARRADCEAGVRALAARFPEIRALRDATLDQLDAITGDVTAQVWRRCRHVITENDRVVRAAAALTRSDYVAFGALMGASHASLRDDYEVSCPELDCMAGIAADVDGVFGARLTGGGFGGCAIALVDASAADARLRETIQQRYFASTGIRADVWICGAGSGVEKIAEGPENTERRRAPETQKHRAV
jgi:galactokinase